jgi:hypothetical protein
VTAMLDNVLDTSLIRSSDAFDNSAIYMC